MLQLEGRINNQILRGKRLISKSLSWDFFQTLPHLHQLKLSKLQFLPYTRYNYAQKGYATQYWWNAIKVIWMFFRVSWQLLSSYNRRLQTLYEMLCWQERRRYRETVQWPVQPPSKPGMSIRCQHHRMRAYCLQDNCARWVGIHGSCNRTWQDGLPLWRQRQC